MDSFKDRLAHAWSVFRGRDGYASSWTLGYSSSDRPDRLHYVSGADGTIVAPIYSRIANDVASINIYHARINQNGSFEEIIDDNLNRCLTIEANIDQSSRAFILDAAMSLFDEGCIAIVAVDTDVNTQDSLSFDVRSLRVARIVEWFPEKVRVRAYNDRTGQYEEIIVDKKTTAIIENPFYAIMNEPNGMVKRLINKLRLLDITDNKNSSGKIDLLVQLPYVVKSKMKQDLAEERRRAIEDQLENSKYGVAYIDSTEHVTQLNRAVENKLFEQIQYYTTMVYNQLGLTEAVFNGTADESTMLNYYNRTVEPVIAAICDGMKRAFLTKTAITQGQSIIYIRSPFKLVPTNNLADIVDKFTRNEILSSNEVRAIIGYKPSEDPRADELRNKNIAAAKDQLPVKSPTADEKLKEEN